MARRESRLERRHLITRLPTSCCRIMYIMISNMTIIYLTYQDSESYSVDRQADVEITPEMTRAGREVYGAWSSFEDASATDLVRALLALGIRFGAASSALPNEPKS